MLSAFWNTLKVKEIRVRLLFTALIIVLVRFASNIPCPGVNSSALLEYTTKLREHAGSGGIIDMLDLFSGGALENFALGALGIMPYITASIILQLLMPVLPSLEKIAREGESGRQKINQYTRYLTIVVCLIQGVTVAMAMVNPSRLGLPAPSGALFVGNQQLFVAMTVVVLTCTTMIFMWLGEQITDRGIGNGVSLIITINIIARLPAAVFQLVEMTLNQDSGSGDFRVVHLLLLLIVFVAVTAATIMLSQGYRRIPIQMVRKAVGSKLTGGATHMPLKVNFAGVMPIIFAGALMVIPEWVCRYFNLTTLAAAFQYMGTGYMITYGLLVFAFTYFWVGTQFKPVQIADNLKKEGAYIPGISPGNPTADYLDTTMTRITFGGAVFLVALALFPMFLYGSFKIPFMVAQFFGGTSLLIMVGVVLDTMTQLESHLTMRHYDGFLKSGRLKGRN
ncbi:MAG: preprotein translocase subunit SecY [Victivallaceae bacterium]|nr:preprotein translocase subunit SecY [Victivallaceae bacterium]